MAARKRERHEDFATYRANLKYETLAQKRLERGKLVFQSTFINFNTFMRNAPNKTAKAVRDTQGNKTGRFI